MNSKERKYITNQISLEVNVGEMLKTYFKNHKTRKAALARLLNRNPNTVLRYQKNTTIQVAILWEISKIVKHNFFLDIASKLPTDFTTNAPIDLSLQEKISSLEFQLQMVTAERDILLKAIK